jgi:hypothetical protein
MSGGRLIAVGNTGAYLASDGSSAYELRHPGLLAPLQFDLIEDGVPLAHALMAEAEIYLRELEGSLADAPICGFCGAELNSAGTAHLPPWGEHEEPITIRRSAEAIYTKDTP